MSANDFLMFLYIFNIVTFSDTFLLSMPTSGGSAYDYRARGSKHMYSPQAIYNSTCTVAHSHREFIVQVSSCQTNVNLELFVFEFPCSVFRILQKRPTVPYVTGLIACLMTGNNNEAVLHKPQSSKPLSSSLIVILCHSL